MLIRRFRRRLASALDRRFGELRAEIAGLERRVVEVTGERDATSANTSAAIAQLQHSIEAMGAELHATRETTMAALRTIARDDKALEQRLYAVRTDAAYEAVFEDPDPLVSLIIPTLGKTDLLLTRSLPSVLAQTYSRLEIIVAGAVPMPEMQLAVESIDDPRVRFMNTIDRTPEQTAHQRWMVGGAMQRNTGRSVAQGSWLVDFDDDDALRPDAIETGLAHARTNRLEVAYGAFDRHDPDGTVETQSAFPPRYGLFSWQGVLTHSSLKFFEDDATAVVFGLSHDWYRVESMLRAGVRFGMHDKVVFDYYPSMRAAG